MTTDRFGSSNSAYAFDGNGDYIDCGNAASVNITGSLTISAWLFALDFNDARGIVSKSPLPPIDDAYQLVAGPYVPSDLNFLNSDFGYLVPTLTWVHVVSVFDSSSQTISLYANGSLDTTLSVAFSSIGTSSDNLCLGTHRPAFTPNWSWNGTLDEIGIWNRALTSSEISNIYSGGSTSVFLLIGRPCVFIYPNPTQSFITLTGQDTRYVLSDEMGRIISAGHLTGSQAIDLSSYSNGVYFLKVAGDNRAYKVLKVN